MAEPPSGSATVPAVEVDGVSKRFGRTLALDGLSLRIEQGEMFALLGPNGAGKTTLISILSTLLRPDAGSARICGADVVRDPLKARKRLGVVFQEPSLDARLTAEENLDFHGRIHRMPARLRRERIDEMLAMVELTDVRKRLVRSLSPGMRRRLEIARAVLHDSSVLILDEPTVGLDAQSREKIWDYLVEARNRRGITLVVTTHYIDEVERCDRICIVDHGKVLALDTPDALRARFGHEVVRIEPRDQEAGEFIQSLYPDAVLDRTGMLVLKGEGQIVIDDIMARCGPQIRQLSFERPSLHSAFLNLTGRDLRGGEGPVATSAMVA